MNKDFQDAFLISQNDPSQENLATLNSLKERTEKYYEEKVKGVNVRSRARWHEHGERNSKYFLKLEKINHIRKHIRKLYRSDVITTDHFEILTTDLFTAKYEINTRTYGSPTLTDEQRQSTEGKTSLKECIRVLNPFPLNKVPGNDGLPVEFHKMFWDSIEKILVECFNKSFAKGEMSSPQRQAVITLTEKKDQDRCDLKDWRPISL